MRNTMLCFLEQKSNYVTKITKTECRATSATVTMVG